MLVATCIVKGVSVYVLASSGAGKKSGQTRVYTDGRQAHPTPAPGRGYHGAGRTTCREGRNRHKGGYIICMAVDRKKLREAPGLAAISHIARGFHIYHKYLDGADMEKGQKIERDDLANKGEEGGRVKRRNRHPKWGRIRAKATHPCVHTPPRRIAESVQGATRVSEIKARRRENEGGREFTNKMTGTCVRESIETHVADVSRKGAILTKE